MRYSLPLAAVLAAALAGCGAETAPAPSPAPPPGPGGMPPMPSPPPLPAPPPGAPGQGPTSGLVPYPLDTCVVSGEKLGSMGDPVVIQHGTQEVKFCCGNCVEEFQKDPEKFLEKIRAANAGK